MKRRLAILALILFSMTLFAERTKLRPGTNRFSPQDDIELGKEAAADAEKQLPMINDRDANAYISSLGRQLVAKAPNEFKFPFTFKIVNDKTINAFALPGGPVFVHRGAIEAADNEAQLAGVMGHEIGHVILRHGTNQATKALLPQAGAAILGAILGDRGVIGQAVSQLGAFAANGVLLRYSRDAETQADLMGTQILYDTMYDPHAMAQFFDKLAKEHAGTKTEQFFSNHPIPENRITNVNAEIAKIGPAVRNPRTDSTDFQRVKRTMLGLPDPPKTPAPGASGSSNGKPAGKPAAPAPPSTRLTDFRISGIALRHPDNWKPSVQGTNITLAPDGGVVAGQNGQGGLAYGMLIDVFKPANARTLDQATSQFLDSIAKGNPSMKLVRSRVRTTVDGLAAQLTEVTNASPVGGQETDVIITVLQSSDQLRYFIAVAPANDYARYQNAFRAVMDSVRLR